MLALLLAGCGPAPRAEPPEILVFDDPGPKPSASDRLIVGSNPMATVDPADGTLTNALLACGQTKISAEGLDMDHGWTVTVPMTPDLDALIRCVSNKTLAGQVFRVRVEKVAAAKAHRSVS